MNSSDVIRIGDYLPCNETIIPVNPPKKSDLTSTSQKQEEIIESGTNTLDYEIYVTPNKFILKSNENYKLIKSNQPLSIISQDETANESTPTTFNNPYNTAYIKSMFDDISALTNENYVLHKKVLSLVDEIRLLREKNRQIAITKESIKRELKDEYTSITKGELEQLNKIMNLQVRFLLEGIVVLLVGLIGMLMYYGFDFKFFTPILYFALILGGLGWFFTALISIRRNE